MSIEHTAIHEAGHAIAACELEMLYSHCSLEPNDKRGTAGNVSVAEDEPHPTASDAAFKDWALNHAIIDYAGHAALVVLAGIGDMSEASAEEHGAGHDFEQARGRCGGDRAAMEACRARAVDIVTRRADDVRKITSALLERRRLSAQQIDWILYRPEPIPAWLD